MHIGSIHKRNFLCQRMRFLLLLNLLEWKQLLCKRLLSELGDGHRWLNPDALRLLLLCAHRDAVHRSCRKPAVRERVPKQHLLPEPDMHEPVQLRGLHDRKREQRLLSELRLRPVRPSKAVRLIVQLWNVYRGGRSYVHSPVHEQGLLGCGISSAVFVGHFLLLILHLSRRKHGVHFSVHRPSAIHPVQAMRIGV